MRVLRTIIATMAIALGATEAAGQYYQMASQIADMIQPVLSGGFRYRGFAEMGYSKGLGNYSADFVEINTTQGLQYSNWFFMGVGAGVDVMMTQASGDGSRISSDRFPQDNVRTTAAMMPLYTDFRFTFGAKDAQSVGAYVDLRLGASFLMGSDFVQIGDRYFTADESFYLRPSIGVRVPLSTKNPKLAMNLGVAYKLLTSNSWYGTSQSVTLNNIGFTASFEW